LDKVIEKLSSSEEIGHKRKTGKKIIAFGR